MEWANLTDSGGFQAFSLAKLSKISEEEIAFQSHLDGSKVFLGPQEVMSIQSNLGSDIAMVIDECPPFPARSKIGAKAVERTTRWARKCREVADGLGFLESGHHVFAIAQGSTFEDLRRQSAEELSALEFFGLCYWRVSVGEPRA